MFQKLNRERCQVELKILVCCAVLIMYKNQEPIIWKNNGK